MMPNISRGNRVHGLLAYLWGPGRSDEHTNPHVVAGYKSATRLEPPMDPVTGKPDFAKLAAQLEAPIRAQEKPSPRYVWQCSLSLPADEGMLDDERWAAIARRFISEMGLERCRWIAVHHGQSVRGNDHIHLMVTLANDDGSKPRLHGDGRMSQQVCDKLEDEFGLAKRTPGRAGASARKATTREEVSRAARDQVPVARTALRRAVRAAVAGARSEREWLENLAAVGIEVHPRVDEDGTVTGYSARLPESHEAGDAWFAGSTLDQELSLPRLRDRWNDAPLTEEEWETILVEPPAGRELSGAERAEVWSASAKWLRASAQELKDLDKDDPRWPASAQACADVLIQTAVVVEPDDVDGAFSRAADLLVRAAAPDRQARELDRRLAEKIGIVGSQMRAAGAARRRGEEALLAAVVVAAVQLAVVVATWRAAQEDRAAANVARTAALQLKPFVTRAPVPTARTGPERGRAAAMPMPPSQYDRGTELGAEADRR